MQTGILIRPPFHSANGSVGHVPPSIKSRSVPYHTIGVWWPSETNVFDMGMSWSDDA
jgi:hypothetical protein